MLLSRGDGGKDIRINGNIVYSIIPADFAQFTKITKAEQKIKKDVDAVINTYNYWITIHIFSLGPLQYSLHLSPFKKRPKTGWWNGIG